MKIRVMIVDDEPIAAQATALMAGQWDEELEVVGLCFSGRDAINSAAVQRPDLIIMDIQMPGINGLEAMRHILRQSPGIQFIILSAYSEFGYAVEALNLGASDYLLKPVKQEDLNASIQKVAMDLQSKKQDMNRELVQREQLEIAEPMIKKDFIRALMPGAESDEKLIACATFLHLTDRTCFMLALSCWGENAVQTMRLLFERMAHGTELVFDVVSPQLAAACVPVPRGTAPQAHAGAVTALMEGLMLQQDGELTAGRGGLVQGVMELKTSLRQAVSAINYVGTTPGTPRCAVFDGRMMTLHPPGTQPGEAAIVPGAPSAEQMIERALQHIQENYSRNLTLDEVASVVNLSPYYFSRFFKEATGVNFSETLLQVRIDRAKELLSQPGNSVKDVAFQVGYNDPNYFSKVFHKATGIRASDYRSMYRGQEE